MSTTPLSDKISALIETSSQSLIQEFENVFLNAQLGIVMHGRPEGEPGQKIVIDGSGKTTISLVDDPNGKSMLKACADPDVFENNYKEGINALMSGRELLEMLQEMHDVEGVLVCSASSFNSFPIYKERASTLLSSDEKNELKKKKW